MSEIADFFTYSENRLNDEFFKKLTTEAVKDDVISFLAEISKITTRSINVKLTNDANRVHVTFYTSMKSNLTALTELGLENISSIKILKATDKTINARKIKVSFNVGQVAHKEVRL